MERLPPVYYYFIEPNMNHVSPAKSKLCDLLRNPPAQPRLFRHVGTWILTEASYQGCEIETVIEDLCRLGCVSGGVSHLIYHRDAKRFYIRFMDEIHELLDELEENTGEPLPIQSVRTTTYAWFGFEAMANRIFGMLED